MRDRDFSHQQIKFMIYLKLGSYTQTNVVGLFIKPLVKTLKLIATRGNLMSFTSSLSNEFKVA